MPNADFQDRLQRIGANSPIQQSMTRGAPQAGRTGMQKLNYGLIAVGAAIMVLGLQAVKYANENYEAIRDSNGIGAAAGLGLVGMVALLIGVIVMMRAVFKRRATLARADASQYSANVVQPVRKAPTGARVFFSLLGFAFGTIACLYMFMAAAARFVETETAYLFANGGVLIALFLALVSLLFGLVELFFRGYALGRVPVYFLFGGVLTFATVRIAGINMLEWQQFTTMLQ